MLATFHRAGQTEESGRNHVHLVKQVPGKRPEGGGGGGWGSAVTLSPPADKDLFPYSFQSGNHD